MCCEGREHELALYAGGDLREDERAAVERHLETCVACHEFVSEIGAARTVLGSLKESVTDEFALEALSARIIGATEKQPRRRIALQRATLATALAACISLGIAVMQMQDRGMVGPPAGKKIEIAVDSILDRPVESAPEPPIPVMPDLLKPDRVLAKILTHDSNIVIILLATDNDEEDSDAKNDSVL